MLFRSNRYGGTLVTASGSVFTPCVSVPVASQIFIFFLSSLLKRDQDGLCERSIGTTLWCLLHLQMRLNRWNWHIDWWNSSPMKFSLKTYCWSVSHTIRRSLRMSLPTPIMSRSLSSLYVKSCGMPTNEVNEQIWLFKAFTAIACSSATVGCCYLQSLLFRLEEGVLFWPPVNECKKLTCFAHMRMKLPFVSWTHSLF